MLQPILNAANAAFKQKGKTFHFGMGGAQQCRLFAAAAAANLSSQLSS
jgi:hypothetical protein